MFPDAPPLTPNGAHSAPALPTQLPGPVVMVTTFHQLSNTVVPRPRYVTLKQLILISTCTTGHVTVQLLALQYTYYRATNSTIAYFAIHVLHGMYQYNCSLCNTRTTGHVPVQLLALQYTYYRACNSTIAYFAIHILTIQLLTYNTHTTGHLSVQLKIYVMPVYS